MYIQVDSTLKLSHKVSYLVQYINSHVVLTEMYVRCLSRSTLSMIWPSLISWRRKNMVQRCKGRVCTKPGWRLKFSLCQYYVIQELRHGLQPKRNSPHLEHPQFYSYTVFQRKTSSIFDICWGVSQSSCALINSWLLNVPILLYFLCLQT